MSGRSMRVLDKAMTRYFRRSVSAEWDDRVPPEHRAAVLRWFLTLYAAVIVGALI